ncbi:class E sortase [Nesterenkonia sp. MY13]|uniref:Class E sortase n=1 Tax=Nesterenkonia sedimenti TaxID=1463632 RepID=A0A7X8YEN5_9MICC|nr:class E sortase [Nesterenkonia sedimenti]NLS10794.1 class E sortase [Nesterenkonia sedimenti]
MTLSPPRHAASPVPPSPPAGKKKPRRSVGSKVLGGFGEILITLGVLGLLFVVWELWWTGIEAESDRQDSLNEFYANAPEGFPEISPGGEDDEEEGTDSGPTPADFEVCYTLDDGTEIGCAPHMRSQTGPEQIMGTVYAPRLGDTWAAPIRHGTTTNQIDRGGVGHYVHTEFPDEPGNFALAGHRNTNASMLGNQDDLQTGDAIYVVSYDGIYVYEVAERHVVTPQSTEVLASLPGEPGAEAETGVLTFTTCHPMFSNRERLIHHAEIVDFVPIGGQAPDELAHHEYISQLFYTGGEA